jgi:hypothetical protein
MKRIKIIAICILCMTSTLCVSQVKYDNGPIFSPLTPPPNAFVAQGNRWNCQFISYMFLNGTGDIAGDGERNGIRQAFGMWQAQTGLIFREVFVENQADIRIMWSTFDHGDPCVCAFDGQGNVLAHGFFPPPNLDVFAGDVHFDDSEDWTLDTRSDGSQPIDLVTVAAHEIGHALGLNHTTVSNSLMNSNYTGSHRFLGQDDIDGIRSIYGNPISIVSTPQVICNTGNFTVQNLPTTHTIFSWSSSNPSALSINAITGIGTRVNNFNGQVTVTAIIGGVCGNVAFTKDIAVGTGIGDPLFEQKTISCPTGPYFYSILGRVTQSFDPSAFYKWYIGTAARTNFVLKATSSSNSATVPGDAVDNLYHTLRVDITNSCGTISTALPEGRYRASCSGGGGGTFAVIFPNPASSQLSVGLSSSPSSSSPLRANSVSEIDENTTFEANLFNSFQQLVMTGASQNGTVNFNLTYLQNGIYYLHINTGTEIIRKQVMIFK